MFSAYFISWNLAPIRNYTNVHDTQMKINLRDNFAILIMTPFWFFQQVLFLYIFFFFSEIL